jgi:hypothetical protein
MGESCREPFDGACNLWRGGGAQQYLLLVTGLRVQWSAPERLGTALLCIVGNCLARRQTHSYAALALIEGLLQSIYCKTGLSSASVEPSVIDSLVLLLPLIAPAGSAHAHHELECPLFASPLGRAVRTKGSVIYTNETAPR